MRRRQRCAAAEPRQPGSSILHASCLQSSSRAALSTLLSHPPAAACRNVTISSADPSFVLDLASVTAVVELCSSCTFTFANISTANEVPSGVRSVVISIFRGQPGSRIITVNYTSWRLVCLPTSSSIANIRTLPRSPWFADTPGAKQQVESASAVFQVSSMGPARQPVLSLSCSCSQSAMVSWIELTYSTALTHTNGRTNTTDVQDCPMLLLPLFCSAGPCLQ